MSAVGRAWTRMLAAAAAALALDQLSKIALRGALEPGERSDLFLGVDLVRVTNEGIAFGFLDDGGAVVVIVAAASLALVLGWFATAPTRAGLWLGVGLVVGGALGNLLDRVRDGGVTDFIDPPLWPAFNVADVAITCGVIVLVLSALAPDSRPEEAPG